MSNTSKISTFSLPDLVEIQRASFCWFLEEGLAEEIKGAGHWVQAEKPKDFLEIVSNFLKSNYSKN